MEEDDYGSFPVFFKGETSAATNINWNTLISIKSYPIGYQIFEGDTSEIKTLIPALEAFQMKLEIDKPILVADAAMLSKKKIDALQESRYEYIIGGLA